MSDTVIRVNNLGKLYQIGTARNKADGLRHAVDADHIAAIDNVVRKLMQEGKRPVSVGFFFSLGHSTVVFVLALLVYSYLPNRRASLRFGIPGAIVTAIGYSIAQVAFGIYTAHANLFQIYGTLSAIFALMLWVYYVCVIFLYGAHVSAQWEAHYSPKPQAALGSPAGV